MQSFLSLRIFSGRLLGCASLATTSHEQVLMSPVRRMLDDRRFVIGPRIRLMKQAQRGARASCIGLWPS